MSAGRRFDGWLRRIQGLLWFIVATRAIRRPSNPSLKKHVEPYADLTDPRSRG